MQIIHLPLFSNKEFNNSTLRYKVQILELKKYFFKGEIITTGTKTPKAFVVTFAFYNKNGQYISQNEETQLSLSNTLGLFKYIDTSDPFNISFITPKNTYYVELLIKTWKSPSKKFKIKNPILETDENKEFKHNFFEPFFSTATVRKKIKILDSRYYALKGIPHISGIPTPKSLLVQIIFYNEKGEAFTDYRQSGLDFSKQFGHFLYINPSEPHFKHSFYAPKGVDSLEISFHILDEKLGSVYISDIILHTSFKPLAPPKLSPPKKNLRDKIYQHLKTFNVTNDPVTLIYADVSINTIDSSSIWLSSVTTLFSLKGKVILLSKRNKKNNTVISNIKNLNNILLIEPKHLGLSDDLKLSTVREILVFIDEVIPNIQTLLVRDIEAITEVIKTNNFKYRLVPYLTNFYDQRPNGLRRLKDGVEQTIKLLTLHAKSWLWQTEDMQRFLEKSLNIKFYNSILLPPLIPPPTHKNNNPINREEIIIGYAGKIQPDWGILELIEEVDTLRKKGFKITLRIVSSKISDIRIIKSERGFVEKVRELLKKEFIEFIEDVNRETSIKLMSDVDYIWSWRHKDFEDTTLELSTKLLDGISLNKPVINYPSKIHRKTLGNNYPYYLETPSDLENLLKKSSTFSEGEKIDQKYSYNSRLKDIECLFNKTQNTRILFNGHDFKFIDHYYSYLKAHGYLVYKDYWEWGTPDNIERSKDFFKKSDIILCEWGLANAVWYSKQDLGKDKNIIVRIHAQEIRPLAANKFGKHINFKNIDKLIFVSKNIQSQYLKLFDVDSKISQWIPNYVLTEDFKPARQKQQLAPIFGIVGIIPQSKGLEKAVDMMEEILTKHPDAKLYIKGYLPKELVWFKNKKEELAYYEKIFDRIKKSPTLNTAIIFDGHANDMALWYQKIDIILSPSDHESFHYALADGVASGCLPIVWNWLEADTIYSKEWIVQNAVEAAKKAISYLNLTEQELDNTILKNRSLILERYGSPLIFKQLTSILMSKNSPS